MVVYRLYLLRHAGFAGLSSLVSRNVRVGRCRTSVRLEREVWDVLEEICRNGRLTRHELCTRIAGLERPGGFTSALRVFILGYFRRRAQPSQSRNASTKGSSTKEAAVDSATPPATSSGSAWNRAANR